MGYVKSNYMPLLIGAALGYMIAKAGGIGAVTSKAKSAVSG